jgi:hypothetical protein
MEKKKKTSLGERMRAAILQGSGANAVNRGLNASEGDDMAARVGASGGAPKVAPRRRAEYETQGIFDQGKYDRMMAKKKKK